ncbi:MAG: DMT family transporter [Sphingopyxis sp.]|nr:DMT family transporter [Sphingopyxis sp.]
MIATGALLGLATILAKIAPRAGLSPLAFLAWSVAGAALLLIVPRLLGGERLPVSRRVLEYYAIAALVSLAVPNFIFFAAIPHIGASFVALAIAFPPLLTYAGAVLLGIERFDIGRAVGVGLALAGAALIAFLKLRLVAADMFWVIAVLLGPVLLAIGNLYRTLRWPAGAKPAELAPGMLAAAALVLIAGGLMPGQTLAVPVARPDAALLIAAQSAALALQYRLFFILQQRGGPVMLSLLGTVAAILAVPVAIIVLGEAPPAGLVPGAALIATGIALVTIRQHRGRTLK